LVIAARKAASTRLAAPSCIPGITCVYRSIVVAILA
jgi:hypothetical protein